MDHVGGLTCKDTESRLVEMVPILDPYKKMDFKFKIIKKRIGGRLLSRHLAIVTLDTAPST